MQNCGLLNGRPLLVAAAVARGRVGVLPMHYPSLSAKEAAPRIRSFHFSTQSNDTHQRYATIAHSTSLCRPTWWRWPGAVRPYSSLTERDVRRKVEDITTLFFEARELLGDARASANTVYFDEDMQDARTAVEEAIGQYNDLLSMLSEDQTRSVVTAIGLKMEELKAQLAAITEELDDS